MARRRTVLAQRRRSAGYSQESFAAELGVERTTIARWESGNQTPRPWQLPRIAQALGIGVPDVHALLTTYGVVPSETAMRPVPVPTVRHVPSERAYDLYLRGRALLADNHQSNFEAARTLLDRAAHADPTFARAIADRGYATWRHYFAGWSRHAVTLTDAVADARTAMDLDPDSVTAHLTFVRVAWDMGWHEQGLAAGRNIYQRHPDSLEATITFARALNNAGLAEIAIPLLDAVLTVDPTNPSATKLSVWCHMLTGQHTHAIDLGHRHLRQHPNDANTRWATAMAARNVPGRLPEAISLARDACATDPHDITVWLLLGYLHRANNADNNARATWQQGLNHARAVADATNLRTLVWAANLHAATGHTRQALDLVERVTESQPENAYLTYRRAHVLAELGRPEEAVRLLDDAVTQGFLSIQLAAAERTLALGTLTGRSDYRAVIRRLRHRVSTFASIYAPHLPVAPTHPPGGDA